MRFVILIYGQVWACSNRALTGNFCLIDSSRTHDHLKCAERATTIY